LTAYDKRLHAFRPDLADARLKGEVTADRFVTGKPARIVASVADMLGEPRPDAGLNTQLLRGDNVTVFDEAEGWAWVQAERDGYVGYVSGGFLGPRSETPTHMVSAPRSFLYSGPDLRFPRLGELSLGSSVTVKDFAETLLMTPYLWGGSTAFGIDCSGLVQLSMRMAGRDVPRDSDMQAARLGEPVEAGSGYSRLRRGDLAFWKGHVAIMTDERTMIHANGHTMLVSREGLAEAIGRIVYLYGGPTGFRRPQSQ